jgi:hypothetical protein
MRLGLAYFARVIRTTGRLSVRSCRWNAVQKWKPAALAHDREQELSVVIVAWRRGGGSEMAIDNAEFRKKLAEAKNRNNRIDDLSVAVLKGHMLVEDAVEAFLQASLFNPSYMKVPDMMFRRKVEPALATSHKEDKDPLWSVVWALNQLRNQVAHEQDPKEVEAKMKYLREVFLKTLSPEQAREMEKRPDKEIVEEASYQCSGLFGMLMLDAKGRWAIIGATKVSRLRPSSQSCL